MAMDLSEASRLLLWQKFATIQNNDVTNWFADGNLCKNEAVQAFVSQMFAGDEKSLM